MRLLRPLVAAVMVASSIADAQELTPAAKDSPFADRWITMHGPAGTQGELYQGSTPLPGAGSHNRMFDGGGAWVDAFALVPRAHELAKEARTLQRVSLATFWSGLGLLVGTMGGYLATSSLLPGTRLSPTSILVTGSLGLVACALEVVSLVLGSRWPRLVEEAVREYNSTLNDSLPPEQRFNLGELGKR